MDIYIKPVKKYKLNTGNKIRVKDIAEVFTEKELLQSVQDLTILEINEQKNKSYVLSAIELISKVNMAMPGNALHMIGETDTIIEYTPEEKKDNPLYKWAKICFIAVVLAAGSATAIMSFHTDAQIPVIFKNYYYIVFKKSLENPALIEVPYSIGLAFGIIVFFNHIAGKNITEDPTPVEVEMASYEKSVTDAKIDMLKNTGNHGDENNDADA